MSNTFNPNSYIFLVLCTSSDFMSGFKGFLAFFPHLSDRMANIFFCSIYYLRLFGDVLFL